MISGRVCVTVGISDKTARQAFFASLRSQFPDAKHVSKKKIYVSFEIKTDSDKVVIFKKAEEILKVVGGFDHVHINCITAPPFWMKSFDDGKWNDWWKLGEPKLIISPRSTR